MSAVENGTYFNHRFSLNDAIINHLDKKTEIDTVETQTKNERIDIIKSEIPIEWQHAVEIDLKKEPDIENYEFSIGVKTETSTITKHRNIDRQSKRLLKNNNLWHVCEVCNLKFKCFNHLEVHMYEEHGNGRRVQNKCKMCLLNFKWPSVLRHHAINVHLASKISKLRYCQYCYKTFNATEQLRLHIKRMHVAVHLHTIYCEKCHATFRTKTKLHHHTKVKHSKNYEHGHGHVKCKLCHRKFIHKYYFKEHYEEIHWNANSAYRFSCHKCLSYYRYRSSLFKHTQQKHYNYKCDTCNKTLKSQQSLFRHEKTRHEIYKHRCRYCTESYRAKGSLIKHIHAVHNDKITRVSCTQCDTTFTRIESLKLHEMTLHSHNPPKYSCERCGKSYKWITGLNYHRKHGHKRPSTTVDLKHQLIHQSHDTECFICNITFTTEESLKNHIHQMHRGIKRVPCLNCNATFASIYNLKMHIETVHAVKRETYACEICGKLYKCKRSYAGHMENVHEVNYDYLKCICDYCETTCTSKKELIDHIACHLLPSEFGCVICGRVFSMKNNLILHFRVKHEETLLKKSRLPLMNPGYHIKCFKCDETFTKGKFLRRHLADSHKLITICR